MTTPCPAELHIGDDFADNHATMKCELEDGHDGPHVEHFFQGAPGARDAKVEWHGTDKEMSDAA